MPLYEYRCADCSLEFEKLVPRWTDSASCPACSSQTVEKKISTFAVSSSASSAPSLGCDSPGGGCGAPACGGGSCGMAN